LDQPKKEFDMLTRNQLTGILLFFFVAGLIGLVLGGALAKNFMPITQWQVALFTIAGLSGFVLGLGLMLWKRKDTLQSFDQSALYKLVSVREEYPRALVPVKALKPESRLIGRGRTD